VDSTQPRRPYAGEVNRSDAAEDRPKTDGRGPFERFVEAVNQIVSRAPFFAAILVSLGVWAVSYPLWTSTTKWELALHTGASILSLLLLVLLENSGRRTEEAAQEKLNVIAEALSDLMESRAQDDPALRTSAERLREAVGLEERH
jgi:low affinity Fe/Cu permease